MDEFDSVMGKQYGQVESQLGQGLYEANTESAKSYAALKNAQANVLSAVAVVIWLGILAVVPPLAVFMWRWALG